jgi:AcrR family transcriptional regulator
MNRIVQSRSVVTRTNGPARNLSRILELATSEFAQEGFSAARIDHIAAARAPENA